MSEKRGAENDAPAYTEADQRADTAFLVGAHYGREAERARMLAEGYVLHPARTDQ